MFQNVDHYNFYPKSISFDFSKFILNIVESMIPYIMDILSRYISLVVLMKQFDVFFYKIGGDFKVLFRIKLNNLVFGTLFMNNLVSGTNRYIFLR